MRSNIAPRVGTGCAAIRNGHLPQTIFSGKTVTFCPLYTSELIPNLRFLTSNRTRPLQSSLPTVFGGFATRPFSRDHTSWASSIFRDRLVDTRAASPTAWVLDRRKQYNFLGNVRHRDRHRSVGRRSYTFSKDHGSPRATDPRVNEGHHASHPESIEQQIARRTALSGKGFRPGMAHRHIIDRLPHMPQLQRPTKEELLAAATGFWSRLRVRFKWFSIRSARPFNADEIGAFFSWVLVGHVLWIFLGTTTFFSLAILAVNTVFAQGKLTSRLKDYRPYDL